MDNEIIIIFYQSIAIRIVYKVRITICHVIYLRVQTSAIDHLAPAVATVCLCGANQARRGQITPDPSHDLRHTLTYSRVFVLLYSPPIPPLRHRSTR